tara:strand:+ start:1324 stop:1980 length:657 start_codon:yes stop_codon:yes gene_type:complete
MTKQVISTGSSANDGTGDTLRQAGTKINANFTEIYNLVGDGTNLSSQITIQDSAVVFEGNLADAHETFLMADSATADRTITLPNATGTISLIGNTETLTNKTLTSPTINGAALGGALTGAVIGGVQALSGAGAANNTSLTTQLTTTGSNQAITLANGTNGQIKIVTMVVDGGDGVLTPATFANGTSITFNDVGDTVLLVYNTTGGWALVSNTGCTINS